MPDKARAEQDHSAGPIVITVHNTGKNIRLLRAVSASRYRLPPLLHFLVHLKTLCAAQDSHSTMQITIPHLEKTPNSQQLIVNGEPFLMLAGELQNSSMTSAKFMEEQWPKLTAANINTVLGCVTWEQIEPREGEFDFEEFDKVLEGARRHGLRLVLLWFGSFKNGMFPILLPRYCR